MGCLGEVAPLRCESWQLSRFTHRGPNTILVPNRVTVRRLLQKHYVTPRGVHAGPK